MKHDDHGFLIAGNWKMNGSQELFSQFQQVFADGIDGVSVVVCPPYTLIRQESHNVISVGGQDVSEQASGAHTGEVSAQMLCDAGCRYAIVGHSERRVQQQENDDLIASKLIAAINSGLTGILCIGESEQIRESGQLFSFLESQLAAALKQLNKQQLQQVVVAYEPIWAIGTGNAATEQQVQEVHGFIRDYVCSLDMEVGSAMQLLYGGSVKPSNASALFSLPDVNGALVGGASLQPDTFYEICQLASEKR